MSDFLFKPGNQLWKLRPYNAGPKRIFEGPQELYEALCAYFQWCEDNPIEETQLGWYQGEATEHTVSKLRAMTMVGACAHMDIDSQLWREWRKEREDLAPVIAWADAIMFEQKFTGAAAGVLNPAIIAKDLGLVDRTDISSSDGSMSPKPTIIEFLAPEQVSPAIQDEMRKENGEFSEQV